MPAELHEPISGTEARREPELQLPEAVTEVQRQRNERLRKELALLAAALSANTPPVLRDEAAAAVCAEAAVDASLQKPEAVGFVDALAWTFTRRDLVAE